MRVEWISKTSDFGGGALVLIPNVTHVWREPFRFERLTLYNQHSFARDDGFDGPKNNSKGLFYRWDATFDYNLGKKWHLCLPNFTVQVPLNNPHDGRKNVELAGGISLKRKF